MQSANRLLPNLPNLTVVRDVTSEHLADRTLRVRWDWAGGTFHCADYGRAIQNDRGPPATVSVSTDIIGGPLAFVPEIRSGGSIDGVRSSLEPIYRCRMRQLGAHLPCRKPHTAGPGGLGRVQRAPGETAFSPGARCARPRPSRTRIRSIRPSGRHLIFLIRSGPFARTSRRCPFFSAGLRACESAWPLAFSTLFPAPAGTTRGVA